MSHDHVDPHVSPDRLVSHYSSCNRISRKLGDKSMVHPALRSEHLVRVLEETVMTERRVMLKKVTSAFIACALVILPLEDLDPVTVSNFSLRIAISFSLTAMDRT